MEEAAMARQTAVPLPAVADPEAALATLLGMSPMTGLALFTMMAPFFLNPPLFVTMLMMPRQR
jgi:hypothetical protein